jgi:quercetin dioxygenase-like cupin family protein
MTPQKIEIAGIEPREIMPGHHARFVHSEHTTHAFWEIEADARLPEHSHPHEQIVNVLEGTYELVVGGEPVVLSAGDTLVIPGGVPHSGRAHTGCRILDVFSPVRQEYT